jgi:hypothetical protein
MPLVNLLFLLSPPAAAGDPPSLAAAVAAEDQKATAILDAAAARAIAEIPDERTRPAEFKYNTDALADFAVRLAALGAQHRECDRYAEMRHYLDRVDWKVVSPDTRTAAFLFVVNQRLTARGIGAQPYWGRDTARFLTDEGGMVSSLVACGTPAEELPEIDGLLAAVRAHGLGGEKLPLQVITLDDSLELTWARTRARGYGDDAALQARTQPLLARHPGDADAQGFIRQSLQDVVALAADWKKAQARTRGLPHDEIERRVRAVADGKLAGTPVCQTIGSMQRAAATAWVASLEGGHPSDTVFEYAFVDWAPAADAGCIDGVSGRFASQDAAWAWLDGLHAHATADGAGPQCAASWSSFDQLLGAGRATRASTAQTPFSLVGCLLSAETLVSAGCVAE